MLLKIPGVLNAEQLRVVRARLLAADAPWVDGRVTAGYQGAPVKRNQQIDENSRTALELGDLILGALERNPLFISAALPNRVYPPMFNRYEGGMHFGNHVDGAVRLIPGSGLKLRTDISATLFLEPPENYDGGELLVEDTYGEHLLKLNAGDLAVYPATSRHRVTPVTRGARLACFFWVQSLVRDDGQRRLLLDLDQAVQKLGATGADAQALLQLTGSYHNLLRMWSET
ncbi:MAG: Fe2+-dependent dioxygenase [Nevskia sp.]|nr:Fe2+-dependent dioxygenase [Nevskia sp.]